MSDRKKFDLDLESLPRTTDEQADRVMRMLEPQLSEMRRSRERVTRRSWLLGLASATAAVVAVLVFRKDFSALDSESPPTQARLDSQDSDSKQLESYRVALQKKHGPEYSAVEDLDLYEDLEVLESWNGRIS